MPKTSIASSAAPLRIAAANATKVAVPHGSARPSTARARTEKATTVVPDSSPSTSATGRSWSLEDLIREQVLAWCDRAAAHQLVFGHIDRYGELSAQCLSTRPSFRLGALPAVTAGLDRSPCASPTLRPLPIDPAILVSTDCPVGCSWRAKRPLAVPSGSGFGSRGRRADQSVTAVRPSGPRRHPAPPQDDRGGAGPSLPDAPSGAAGGRTRRQVQGHQTGAPPTPGDLQPPRRGAAPVHRPGPGPEQALRPHHGGKEAHPVPGVLPLSAHPPPARGADRDRLRQLLPDLATKRCQRVATWAAANNVEIAYIPTNSSWLNRIEAQFTALRYFALDGTDHADHHKEQCGMIRRYVIWRKTPC